MGSGCPWSLPAGMCLGWSGELRPRRRYFAVPPDLVKWDDLGCRLQFDRHIGVQNVFGDVSLIIERLAHSVSGREVVLGLICGKPACTTARLANGTAAA